MSNCQNASAVRAGENVKEGDHLFYDYTDDLVYRTPRTGNNLASGVAQHSAKKGEMVVICLFDFAKNDFKGSDFRK